MIRSTIHRVAALGLASLALTAVGGTASGAGVAAPTCLTWQRQSGAAAASDAWHPAPPAAHADPHPWNPSAPTDGEQGHPWAPNASSVGAGERPWHPTAPPGPSARHAWHADSALAGDCAWAPATNR